MRCALVLTAVERGYSQSGELHGQASGWLAANPEDLPAAQLGLRYLPDLLLEGMLGDGLNANMELSLNAFATARYGRGQLSSYDENLKLYRAWLRIATDRFEARIGLQKISFGSAMLFRPLMWFDRIDPRDPLQLTDGVYGILTRYYLQNNANVWLWGLYGNNETKGWEVLPTQKNTVEYGGRVQSTLLTGELGFTYHHRRADVSSLVYLEIHPPPSNPPEDRLALDGKWDVGIGVWFEAALIHEATDIPGWKYQRQWTIGADYTFAVGNGLYVASEYYGTENPQVPFASAYGAGFSGFSLSYPIGIVDQLSGILYRDWGNKEWYRIVNWQRKYDNWSFYVLGFWNPETFRVYQGRTGTTAFAGRGFQIMVVYNH